TSEAEDQRTSLEEPEGGKGTNGVRGNRKRPSWITNLQASQRIDEGEECGDERQLTGLDPDVEGQQRERNVTRRDADLRKRPCESKAVEKAECERYKPWFLIAEAIDSALVTRKLNRQKDDAQRYHRFNRCRSNSNHAESGQRQRDAMGHGEGRHSLQEPAEAGHDQQQAHDEEQMVDASEDMGDAEPNIARSISLAASFLSNREARLLRAQQVRDARAIRERDADEHVHDRDPQPFDLNLLIDEPFLAA